MNQSQSFMHGQVDRFLSTSGGVLVDAILPDKMPYTPNLIKPISHEDNPVWLSNLEWMMMSDPTPAFRDVVSGLDMFSPMCLSWCAISHGMDVALRSRIVRDALFYWQISGVAWDKIQGGVVFPRVRESYKRLIGLSRSMPNHEEVDPRTGSISLKEIKSRIDWLNAQLPQGAQ